MLGTNGHAIFSETSVGGEGRVKELFSLLLSCVHFNISVTPRASNRTLSFQPPPGIFKIATRYTAFTKFPLNGSFDCDS